MKLRKIEIENILSYRKEIITFNDDLNIFVGANGSGKSNLLNIIIYVLKRYCFKNFDITRTYNVELIGHEKYAIREKNPLYNTSEDLFLKKHKLLLDEISKISFTIVFEKNDLMNLKEINKYKDNICDFLDRKVDNVSFLMDKYSVDVETVKDFFNVNEPDLLCGDEIKIDLIEGFDSWSIVNDEMLGYMRYMKYFSLMHNILNLLNISHNVKNPFVFFEAYRNNSGDTTMVSISDFNNNNFVNTQSIVNISSLAYSIGVNSSYIMLATKKYGEMHRKYIQEDNGIMLFENDPNYKKLKDYFSKFGYDINIKCIEPKNNVYQFYLYRDGLSIEIDNVSSGEREVINFIFGMFLEQLQDSIVIIDEPELHLHPIWQKKFIQLLKSETKNKNIQIMFVTHSSNFVSYNVLNNVFRIYKSSSFSKCVKVNDLLDGNDDIRKMLSIINATNNEKIFFSSYVIMFSFLWHILSMRKNVL